jgi:RNA polymerase sigma factor (sigma-70 family)
MNNSSSLLRFIRRIARPSDGETSDRHLLERFASGRDETAFAALVERHGPMVFGVCRRILRSSHDAEDAFQAAFLVLARKAGSIRQPDALGNWLYGVAYRTALEARARAARRRIRERELVEEPGVDPSNDIEWSDLHAVVDDEIRRLPQKYRAPFVLCYLEGRTNEEAARLLRCPKGTILSQLAWARERLRGRLLRRGVALPAAGVSVVLSASSLSAAVPADWVSSTASAARLFASGQAGASAEALAVAKGVLKAMFLDKVKLISLVFLAVPVLGGGLAWLSLPPGATGGQEPPKPVAPVKAEGQLDTLLALEKRVWEAAKKKDADTLRRLSTQDYVAILADGSQLTLNEFCMLFPLFEVQSYSLSDARVISLGPDAAILLYKSESQTVVLGEKEKHQTQHSSTWVRRNGEWRNVCYQETLIEE